MVSPVGSSSVLDCALQTDLAIYPAQFSPFTASITNSAQQNTIDEDMYFCVGYEIILSTCPEYGGTNADSVNYLRLLDASGVQITEAFNDCDLGATLTYAFTETCQKYTFRQGCFLDASCGGTASLIIESKHYSPISFCIYSKSLYVFVMTYYLISVNIYYFL